jgi:hypothetical protein
MEFTEQEWAFLRKEIEKVEYGRIVIFRSPDKKALNFTIEKSYRLPGERSGQAGRAKKI